MAHLTARRNFDDTQALTPWEAAIQAPPGMTGLMDTTLRNMYAHTQAEFAAEGIESID